MVNPGVATLTTLLVLWCAPAALSSAFTVEAWVLETGVADLSSGQDDSRVSATVINPFYDSHFASVGASTAESWFDFGWSGEAGLGTFLVDVAHQARDVGGSGLVSNSVGRISIETTQDITIDILGFYNYNTPATYFDTEIRLAVLSDDPFETFIMVAQHGGPFGGHPSSGTLNVAGTAVLPAGDRYDVFYAMEIRSFGGGTNILGTGSGNITLNITPEPSTLSLLAVAALGCLKRRRTRRLTTPRLTTIAFSPSG